jgi:hypothetical protein
MAAIPLNDATTELKTMQFPRPPNRVLVANPLHLANKG